MHVNHLENRNSINLIGIGSTSHFFRRTEMRRKQFAGSSKVGGLADDTSYTKVKPYLFDGLTDINEHLRQFKIVAEINHWICQTKTFELASCLTKIYLSLLSELDAEQMRNFSVLVAPSQSRFGTVNKDEIYRAQLKNRTRERGETVLELAQLSEN